jgi:hypothetical protein
MNAAAMVMRFIVSFSRSIADGELHRIIRELIREIWKPPKLAAHTTSVHRPVKGEAIP